MADHRYLARAYSLAHNFTRTHPNPRVGAVIVNSAGEVIGEGWHEGPGTDHAEVMALKAAGAGAEGSIVYVSLEPCNHHGRTAPCTDAIIDAKVSAVVVGIRDPDREVRGGGIERLEEHGIDVTLGDDPDRARSLDEPYFLHRETGLPTVTLKWAMTLDGSVAAADGSSQWITTENARRTVHELRVQSDAVVVGAGTLIADNPRLDARDTPYPDYPQPVPVVISGTRDLPADAQIWEREPVVVATTQRTLPSGELLIVPGSGGIPDPEESCRALAERGLLQLMLEGGPSLAGSWWRAGVITNGFVHIGAKIGGGTGKSPMAGVFATITDADAVEFDTVRSVSDDVVIEFRKKG